MPVARVSTMVTRARNEKAKEVLGTAQSPEIYRELYGYDSQAQRALHGIRKNLYNEEV